jgi:hypothetical protein
MGHQTQGKQSVVLETFGGLISNASPESIPEGSSSLCFDCDFVVGSVFNRAGLISPYTFGS